MATVTTLSHYVLHLSPAEAQVVQNALTVISAERVTTPEDSESTEAADVVNDHITNVCEALHQAGVAFDDNTLFSIDPTYLD